MDHGAIHGAFVVIRDGNQKEIVNLLRGDGSFQEGGGPRCQAGDGAVYEEICSQSDVHTTKYKPMLDMCFYFNTSLYRKTN